MKVSVIIPTCGRIVFLHETILSVLAQDFPKNDYEVLVVDNSPIRTNEISSICSSYNSSLLRYVYEPNNGLHNARHTGAKVAQGQLLIYIDDDVICPPTWLNEMIAPYNDKRVGMVAGKVALSFEVEAPPWIDQFRNILSELDLGNSPFILEPYQSPVGCNMSVRKDILFQLGGFNPDGFSDPSLTGYRGDGECGLARKVHKAGFLIMYAPRARLQHRVPKTRMTLEYINKRSVMAGIEYSYAILRYFPRSRFRLAFSCLVLLVFLFYDLFLISIYRYNTQKSHRYQAKQMFHAGRLKQTIRQIFSEEIRNHTKHKFYL